AIGFRPLPAVCAPATADDGLITKAIYEPAGTATDCCEAMTVSAVVALPKVAGLKLKSAVPKNQKVTLPDCGWAVKPAAQAVPPHGSSEVLATTMLVLMAEFPTTH